MVILGRLFLIFDFLLSIAKKSGAQASSQLTPHPAVRQTIDLMHSRMAEDWSLERFARLMRLHPSYLVRLFRSETGASPMKMLARIRAERAATLLLSGDARVGDIGLAVGCRNPNNSPRASSAISASAHQPTGKKWHAPSETLILATPLRQAYDCPEMAVARPHIRVAPARWRENIPNMPIDKDKAELQSMGATRAVITVFAGSLRMNP